MSFFDELRPASFRGVPFGVLADETQVGRRVALHEYPYRDDPWPEDLGRASRKYAFTGFLVENSLVYGGGDVIGQRDALLDACETEGPGILVHPTLGTLSVSLLEAVSIRQKFDKGRYFEIDFRFVRDEGQPAPDIGDDTGALTDLAADALDAASSGDFVSAISDALDLGAAVIDMGIATVTDWVDSAISLAGDASALWNTVATLPGNFGRYFGGRTRGYTGALPRASASTTVPALIAAGAANRELVSVRSDALVSAMQGGDPASMASAAQGVASAMLNATADPADSVRLLAVLAAFMPSRATTLSPTGVAVAAMQTGAGALLRRSAISALARAAALYQPSSADDAVAIRDAVVASIDSEITAAGDSGDDASYQALCDLRGKVISDLNARGALLPPMRTFSFNAPLPSLALANRLYKDASRADELVIEANPVHPAFMPVTFNALAS